MLVNITLKFPLLASLGACLRFKETKKFLLLVMNYYSYLIQTNYAVTCKLLIILMSH